jgi:uncharacterized protein
MTKDQFQPWWRFSLVWMVLAGPAIVVVASFITLYLALSIPDPVVTSHQSVQTQAVKSAPLASTTNMAPAMQARNHAATGVSVPAEP